MRAIETQLTPLGFALPQKDRQVVGGYFVWLALPSALSANVLASRCKDAGVIVAPGPIFEVPGDDSVQFDEHVRLCFSWEAEAKLEAGVQLIARVAKELIEESEGTREGYVIVEKGGDGEHSLDAFK